MRQRIIGFDVARALAIFGMVIVNFKIVMSEKVGGQDWAVWFTSLFEGRASALFVILAGIGITFLTNEARQSADTASITGTRIALLKRALLLIIIGVMYMPIWDADILHYYGFYFLISVIIFTFSSQKLLIITVVLALIFPILMLLFDYEYDWDWDTLTYQNLWTIEGFIKHTFFNGVHPVFPWAAFLVFGMWLGRQNLSKESVRKSFFIYALLIWGVIEVLFYSIGLFSSVNSDTSILSITPMPPMPQYLLTAGSLATIVIMVCLAISKYFAHHIIIKWLSQTGQLSLTLYVAHVIIGMGFLEEIGKLENQPAEFALFSALIFCIFSIIFSTIWLAYFKTGPLEFIFRKLVAH